MQTYSIDQKTMLIIGAIMVAICVLMFSFGLLIGLSVGTPQDSNQVAETTPMEIEETVGEENLDASSDPPISTAEYTPVQSQPESKAVPAVEQELSQPKIETK